MTGVKNCLKTGLARNYVSSKSALRGVRSGFFSAGGSGGGGLRGVCRPCSWLERVDLRSLNSCPYSGGRVSVSSLYPKFRGTGPASRSRTGRDPDGNEKSFTEREGDDDDAVAAGGEEGLKGPVLAVARCVVVIVVLPLLLGFDEYDACGW